MKKTRITFLAFLFLLIPVSIMPDSDGSNQILTEKPYNIDTIRFKKLGVEEGLCNSTVTCIIQGPVGFLWIGTINGLNRYDGYNIRVYKHDPLDPNSISHNRILAGHVDRQGRLVFLTGDHSLNFHDPSKGGFRSVKVIPGTSGNTFIRTFLEDSDGFFWFGTNDKGLIRMDPDREKLKTYLIDTLSEKPAVKQKILILKIFNTRDNALWVGTNRGLFRYDRKNDRFLKYPAHPDPGKKKKTGSHLRSDLIRDILEDRDGNLWIGTIFGGLHRLNPADNTIIHYPFNDGSPNSLPGNSILNIFEDSTGKLWIWCVQMRKNLTFAKRPLVCLNRENNDVVTYQHDENDPNSISQDSVRRIWEDSRRQLWMHTFGGGLDLYNRRERNFFHYSHERFRRGSLGSNDITCFFEDQSGTVWFGTESSGVSYFDPGWVKFPHYYIQSGAQYRDNNQSVIGFYKFPGEARLLGHNQIIWLATTAGLNRWDRLNNRYRFFEINPKIPDVRVTGMCDDDRGNVWIGTGLGLYRVKLTDFKNKQEPDFQLVIPISAMEKGIVKGRITALFKDQNNRIWLSSTGHGFGEFFPETGTIEYHTRLFRNNPNDEPPLIKRIHRGNDNKLWLNGNHSLDLFDPKKDSLQRFYSEDIGCNVREINWVLQSRDGVVWIGTESSGLVRFHPKNGTTKIYSTDDGLPDHSIKGILGEYRDNRQIKKLWISTANGLCVFRRKSGTFELYDKNDGLQGNQFIRGSCYLSPEGEMFFGGINGFNLFDPAAISKSRYSPKVVVTGLNIFNRPVETGEDSVLKKPIEQTDRLRLNYRHKVITFEFASLHFSSPDKIQYAYLLEGFEKEWNSNGNRRYATYTNLPHGKYKFRVKATNCDGVWTEKDAVIDIYIEPPFWQTWWFRILLILISGTVILALHKKRMNDLRIRLKTDDEIQKIYHQCGITPREIEIIELLKKKKSYREIEDTLFISFHTVKNHVYNIYKKLDVSNQGELIYFLKSVKEDIRKIRR